MCSLARFLALPTAALLLACGPVADVDTADGDVQDEGALDEASILAYLNGPDSSHWSLMQEARVTSRPAGEINAHIAGPDGQRFNADDNLIENIAELDAIPYVGAATLRALEAYARSYSQGAGFVLEGVTISAENAIAMLQLANTATQAVLDDDVGLDARAARAIVAARPLATVQLLAAVSYVNATALTRLRDWVIAQPVAPPTTGPSILRFAASFGYGTDAYWEEGNDGVFLSFNTERATACVAEMIREDGSVHASRDAAEDLGTNEHGHFFGELGNSYSGSITVRLTCSDATGAADVRTVVPTQAPVIVDASGTVGDGHDETSDHTLGGAHVQYVSERADRCEITLTSTVDGSVVASHTAAGVFSSAGLVPWSGPSQVPTSGSWFVGAWPEGEAHEVGVLLVCTDDDVGAFDESTFVATLPAPVPTVDCGAMTGGSFDGVAFVAADECQAVRFLNAARFSEMGRMSDSGRRIAYDCAPSGLCGFRTSAWQRLAQFADYAGVGATTLTGLHASIDGWVQNGLLWDTVANTWQNRTTLVDQPVAFDNVFVSRRLPNQVSAANNVYECYEIKDAPTSTNYLSACMGRVSSDSAPGCSMRPSDCLDPVVGTSVSLRGTFRQIAGAPGGYRVTLSTARPGPANPAAAP